MPAERTLMYEFVSEAKEHLANIGDDLLALEQRKDDSARYRIDRLFRAVHSVKGGAGFFGRQTIEELAHAMETVLDHLRSDNAAPSAAVIDALLAGADRIQVLLDDVERSNDADVSAPLARLRALAPAQPAGALVPQAASRSPPYAVTETPLAERPREHDFLYGVRVDLAEQRRRHGLTPLAVIQRVQRAGALLDAGIDVADADLAAGLPAVPVWYRAVVSAALALEPFRLTLDLPGAEVVLLESAPAPAPPPPALPPPGADASGKPAKPARPAEAAESIRIPVGLVDQLMTLAGELVLVRNQALRSPHAADAGMRPIVQRLDAVTGELQEVVLRTRMQPVGNLFNRFTRMVRDLAKQLGKQIELELSGAEVELDKTILESMSDPLTHLVRNCCDHGVEPPAERERVGKPAAGRVSLGARHLGGQIYIEVRDDGRGLNPEKIRRKALLQGLRTKEELARLGTRDVLGLILLPGFSTAAEVTDLSGRGVGMDVVKTNLDRLGGVLEIESEPGRGTAFTLRLPLTLAIIPCLIVGGGGQRYALPQKDLEELVCLYPGQSRTRVEYTFDQEVVRRRDRLLPLVRLEEVLGRPAPFCAATRAEILRKYRSQGSAVRGQESGIRSQGNGDSSLTPDPCPLTPVYFAVVKVGSRRFGLIVDDILTTEEIVVKPMHAVVQPLSCFSGATILGDGRVALILSVEGVARHAGVRFDPDDETALVAHGGEPSAEKQSVLLFRHGPREQFAAPLALIRRVERVRMDHVERIGDREFLTVDGVPTAVLRLDRMLPVSAGADRPEMFLLLPKTSRQPVGLLLSEVIDSDELPVELHREACRADGLLGSAVVRGRLTLFLDVPRLAELGATNGRREPAKEVHQLAMQRRVLLVEDTQFFREVVRGYLETAGYAVETAVHGLDGLQKLDAATFDLVVSDVEMPVMDGFEFARAVRRRPDGKALPLLALTTLDSPTDREKALACGFDRHEAKLDRERFLGAAAALLKERAPGGPP
ncbi:MAG TPA: chemotaxis protein CheW [Gemmataceae bacterium]|nr:chemotaxis protein CheW [Gemmataceae bacterium]